MNLAFVCFKLAVDLVVGLNWFQAENCWADSVDCLSILVCLSTLDMPGTVSCPTQGVTFDKLVMQPSEQPLASVSLLLLTEHPLFPNESKLC